jgi:hypothetical protein
MTLAPSQNRFNWEETFFTRHENHCPEAAQHQFFLTDCRSVLSHRQTFLPRGEKTLGPRRAETQEP